MKALITMIVAAGLAVGFVAPTFAADKMPTTKAACEKAKMKWDEKGGKDAKGACVAAVPAQERWSRFFAQGANTTAS